MFTLLLKRTMSKEARRRHWNVEVKCNMVRLLLLS